MKSMWKIKGFEQQIYCPQHRTAQRTTARSSVIHPSSSPSLFPHTLLSSVSRQKNYHNWLRKNTAQEIITVALPESGGLFAGSRLCVAVIIGEILTKSGW